jgi:hypothetical protein
LLEFPYRHPCTRTELSICSVYLAAVFILEESSCDESFRATGGSHIGSTCALPRDILTLYYPNPMSTNQSTFSKKQSHKWVLINFISDRNTIQYNITDKTNIQKPNSEQQWRHNSLHQFYYLVGLLVSNIQCILIETNVSMTDISLFCIEQLTAFVEAKAIR